MLNLLHTLKKYQNYYFNFFKTLYVNFKLIKFRDAIYLPLVIYGKCDLKLSRSKIILNCKPRFGLIKWGLNQDLFVPSSSPSLLMMINATLYINGYIRFSPGYVLRMSGGIAYLGKNIEFGGGGKLLINSKLSIGDDCRFAFNNIICDTNYHYIVHDNKVYNNNGEIKIGKSVWVGNNCSIVKGSIIPDYSIVGAKSYVNKDFSKGGTGLLLIGNPAMIKNFGFRQIRSPKIERNIREYFIQSPQESIYNITNEEIYYEEKLNTYFV